MFPSYTPFNYPKLLLRTLPCLQTCNYKLIPPITPQQYSHFRHTHTHAPIHTVPNLQYIIYHSQLAIYCVLTLSWWADVAVMSGSFHSGGCDCVLNTPGSSHERRHKFSQLVQWFLIAKRIWEEILTRNVMRASVRSMKVALRQASGIARISHNGIPRKLDINCLGYQSDKRLPTIN